MTDGFKKEFRNEDILFMETYGDDDGIKAMHAMERSGLLSPRRYRFCCFATLSPDYYFQDR
jgi:hypothetical protein